MSTQTGTTDAPKHAERPNGQDADPRMKSRAQVGARKRKWAMRIRNVGLVVAVYVAVVILWEVIVRVAEVPDYLLPAPSEVVVALGSIFNEQGLIDIQVTVVEMLSGLAIATVAGVVAAALIEESPLVRRIVYPALVAFQSIPKVALAPLIMIWAGLGIESKIVLSATVAFFPMLVNSMTGFASTDKDTLDLFKSLHAGRLEIFFRLKLRAFLPSFFAGLKVAYVFSLLGAIVGEFLASTDGLGNAIIQMQFQLNVAGVFAVLVVLAAIGIVGERLITFAERRWTSWVGR